jgi:hypothetical protein
MSGYTTGSDNELTGEGTYTCAYDADGNMISKTQISCVPIQKLLLGLHQSSQHLSQPHNRALKARGSALSVSLASLSNQLLYKLYGHRSKALAVGAGDNVGEEIAVDIARVPRSR